MEERANLIALAVAIVGIPTAVLTLMTAVFNFRENKKELPAEALPALELVKIDPPPNAYRAYTREKYGHYAYVSACLLMTVGGLTLLLMDRESWPRDLLFVAFGVGGLMLANTLRRARYPSLRSSTCHKESVLVRGSLDDTMTAIQKALTRLQVRILSFDRLAGTVEGRAPRKSGLFSLMPSKPDRIWIAVRTEHESLLRVTVEWDGALATYIGHRNRKHNEAQARRLLDLLIS